ncbi:hypothetical protein [Psychrobacter sp. I-STPA10]|uniref:hypothetical protein n=1 Tax=Psychrobacter sp. I-STPA10 TaxID=2585769 RepID=UPI001E339B83|nr:hypothetical protein [Psychrobacter sp. I-STPA10]
MIISLGVGLVTLLTTVYVGKKSWQAFHRMVGITPGQITYIEPSNTNKDESKDLAYTSVIWQQLQLDSHYLKYLPVAQIQHLQRIDTKMQAYDSWQQPSPDMAAKQRRPPPFVASNVVTEETFLLQKLIVERLPEALARYHLIAKSQALTTAVSAPVESSQHLAEALQVVQALLERIEKNLDKVLNQYQQEQLQNLRAMQRYLDSRED